MSFLGFGPTELRILIAIGALKAVTDPWISLGALGSIRLFDLGGAIAAAGMAIVFVVSAIRNTLALSAADPRPIGREA